MNVHTGCASGQRGLILRRGYSPTNARFSTVGGPTAPRVACPARETFLAAFLSRSSISPQVGHTWLRTKRLFSTLALRITALLAGVRGIYHHHHLLTGVCCFVGKDGAELPPARIADALLARCGLRTRLATRRSSR